MAGGNGNITKKWCCTRGGEGYWQVSNLSGDVINCDDSELMETIRELEALDEQMVEEIASNASAPGH